MTPSTETINEFADAGASVSATVEPVPFAVKVSTVNCLILFASFA